MPDFPRANICFHGIGAPLREMEPGEDRYWVTIQQFESILDELATWPDVHISFDDGNSSDLIALDRLLERGLEATFFVLAGRFGQLGSLDADDVRRMRRAGMTIGTHGMDHRPWRGMDAATRDRELVHARDMIADAAGTAIDTAALPLGRYDRKLLADLRRLGYARLYSSDRRIGPATAWMQPRFSVRSDDTASSVRAAVAAAAAPARAVKLRAVGLAKSLR